LPGWWLFHKTIEAILLRSKSPEWFGCYSGKKLILIIICGTVSVGWIIIAKKIPPFGKTINWIKAENWSPNSVFTVFALISTLSYLGTGITVGEDICGQALSSLQFHSGDTSLPNISSLANWHDLSKDNKAWSLRPPGASQLPLLGLYCGLSLGESIRWGLFSLACVGGLGWLRTATRIGIGNKAVLLLSSILGISIGASTTIYGTANIILYALVPWFCLWAIRICSEISQLPDKENTNKTYFEWFFYLLLLGSFAWVKLSGMVIAITLASVPFFRFLFLSLPLVHRLRISGTYILIGLIFWVPFFLLEEVNESQTGFTAKNMYSANDSSIQAPLFGKYFNESTEGGWLIWSTLGAPGYSLPVKHYAHGFRDFMIQFSSVRTWLDHNGINPNTIFGGAVGIFFTSMLLIALKMIWPTLKFNVKIIICCLMVLPFLGLAVLSNRFSFNYLLYPSHTYEYSTFFVLPILGLHFCSKPRSKWVNPLIFGLCFAIPISAQIEQIFKQQFNEKKYLGSSTEIDRSLEPRAFSNAIRMIEEDSKDDSDVLLFLPSGDLGDLYLRTRLRCLGLHFAGGNLPKAEPFRTSKPLNVYCAYSAILKDDPLFQEALEQSFPQSHSTSEISADDEKHVIVLKIHLDPQINENG
jgi:hypothetical protein